MEKKVLTRKNRPTKELKQFVSKTFKGLELNYEEVYYLDYEVDENTGMVNKGKLSKFYTKEQTTRNMKALKSAYFVAQGAATPIEIINFRNKYNIAASLLSLILGFSKNTISNIEKEGVTSLPSGRLIKICLSDRTVFSQYVKTSNIDLYKKEELFRRLTS